MTRCWQSGRDGRPVTATERIEREIAHLRKSIGTGGFTAAEIRDIEASIKALTELLEKSK